MDTKFIDDALKTSKENREKYMSMIVKLKEAIETFESEDIAVPEAAYGSLAFYQSEYNREVKVYLKLLKLSKQELE